MLVLWLICSRTFSAYSPTPCVLVTLKASMHMYMTVKFEVIHMIQQLMWANVLLTVSFSIWGREIHSGETKIRLMKQLRTQTRESSSNFLRSTTYDLGALMSILEDYIYKESRWTLCQWSRHILSFCPIAFHPLVSSIFWFSIVDFVGSSRDEQFG